MALTGTDAGSNALFGNLQKVTAERLGLSPILMAAANSSGGVMGKMIDAQSIVVSSTATAAGRQRSRDLQGRHQAQHGAGVPGRRDRHVLFVCGTVADPGRRHDRAVTSCG